MSIGLHQSVQFSSVTQSCPTLCDPMDCSMPDFPVHHYVLGLAQTHAHWVSDAIQPSHLPPPSTFAFKISQHRGLFHGGERMVHLGKWGLAWLSRNSAPGLPDGDHVCETPVRKMVMIPPAPRTHRMPREKVRDHSLLSYAWRWLWWLRASSDLTGLC